MVTSFRKKAALRIALVSLLLAAVASPLSWFVELEATEKGTVALAMEESGRLLHHHDAISLSGPRAAEHAAAAANTIAGGLFDIAEIYDRNGRKLAEAMTVEGEQVESLLPTHRAPVYRESSYESIHLGDGRWLLRVFVPLRDIEADATGPVTGYFEGVRVVPGWQKEQMLGSSLRVALMVCLASVLCGLALYPVVVYLASDNERKARELLDSHVSMMEALGRAIAKRDSDTGAHNYRVAWIATRIAENMGLGGARMQALIAGSFLHDVGKIGIPDAILLKPGKLDEQEFSIMRSHVRQGEEIVAGMDWLDGASAVVAGHHEKWNGSGYPRQLSGDVISLEARIFAVADVFDALCSKRPYKEAMGFDEAMAILNRDSGTHFDPAVMDVFRPMARAIFDRLEGSLEHDVRGLLMERVRHHFQLGKPVPPSPVTDSRE
jgi:HD-GYP domain-containing protein (c-di-GMP phosphodiesterase class II)